MWKLKRTVSKAFTSKEHFFDGSNDTINTYYRKQKTINVNNGEYVDFEEIKE